MVILVASRNISELTQERSLINVLLVVKALAVVLSSRDISKFTQERSHSNVLHMG